MVDRHRGRRSSAGRTDRWCDHGGAGLPAEGARPVGQAEHLPHLGILFGQRGTAGYVIGFLFHQAIAAVAAILYAVFFNLIGVEGDLWLYGLLGGLIHYALAGPIVAVIPSLNPDTGNLREQGFAYKNYGALDVVTSLVGHLSFGAITGILYGLFHSGGGSGLAF